MIKSILQNAYFDLEIELAAKATDIKEFYETSETVKLRENDKRVDGFEIIRAKIN